jgi:Uma2 family endonuclease
VTTDPSDEMDTEFPNLRKAVVDAWRNAPEGTRVEIIDGELVMMARPRVTHCNAAGELHAELRAPFRLGRGGPGGWVFLIEPELQLGARPDIIDPDIAGWRRERMPQLPDVPALTLAPDWVCEVLSDSTESVDRGRKMRIYRREGVQHLWFVDPRDRVLEVWRVVDGRWREVDTFEGEGRVRAEPFEAIELDLALLWAR